MQHLPFSISGFLLSEHVFRLTCELARTGCNVCRLYVLPESESRRSFTMPGWSVLLLSHCASLLSCLQITYRAAIPACNARYCSKSNLSGRRGFLGPLSAFPRLTVIFSTCKKCRNTPYISPAAAFAVAAGSFLPVKSGKRRKWTTHSLPFACYIFCRSFKFFPPVRSRNGDPPRRYLAGDHRIRQLYSSTQAGK